MGEGLKKLKTWTILRENSSQSIKIDRKAELPVSLLRPQKEFVINQATTLGT